MQGNVSLTVVKMDVLAAYSGDSDSESPAGSPPKKTPSEVECCSGKSINNLGFKGRKFCKLVLRENCRMLIRNISKWPTRFFFFFCVQNKTIDLYQNINMYRLRTVNYLHKFPN